MAKICFLFPGQGAQYPGMGKDLWESHGRIKEIFEAASDISGKDLKSLIFQGNESELKKTENTQIAVTAVNIAAAEASVSAGMIPQGCAGFSLGEYSALYQSGVLTLTDVFTLVHKRGEVMQKASRSLENPGMTAVIGLSGDEVGEVISAGGYNNVFTANFNSPIQTVIAGKGIELDRIEKELENAGAMKIVRLKVSGAFHSPLMQQGADEFRDIIAPFRFSDPTLNLYSNVTGGRITSGKDAKELCVKQIISPVLWVDEEQSIIDDGFDFPVETGPGKVLCGLWKSFNKKIRCYPAGSMDDINAALAISEQ
ncbi:MAG: ACP S-malonyltransferase [Spirochaetia bacterium]